MVERVELFVELLNENVLVWRPTTAYRLTERVLVLSNENYDPETEEWAVAPGSLVTIEPRQAHGGPIPVAVKYNELLT
ncbi:MAG: hypothetical protein JF588_00570 [Caulobacterales bacterium]|nr:hypothetical protein [Caulobacterales bacterium]